MHETGFYPNDETGAPITRMGSAKPLFVRRRLLTVRATYRLLGHEENKDTPFGKHCGSVTNLVYGTRASYIAGNDDVLGRPVLTMDQECSRKWQFEDWKGVRYVLANEWEYVKGAACELPDCTAGVRDVGNTGRTVRDFSDEVNSFIEERRRQGYGTVLPSGEFAYLTTEEVLAVRLFSGPAHQLLNSFLRQVAKLDASHRQVLANDPEITFAATVRHICRAIRKLSAVATPEETAKTLWRAVRGELPRTFWVPDEQQMICATELGFMSTSRNKATPLNYMDTSRDNLLWVISARAESSTGYHCGADISMLSQFSREQEGAAVPGLEPPRPIATLAFPIYCSPPGTALTLTAAPHTPAARRCSAVSAVHDALGHPAAKHLQRAAVARGHQVSLDRGAGRHTDENAGHRGERRILQRGGG